MADVYMLANAPQGVRSHIMDAGADSSGALLVDEWLNPKEYTYRRFLCQVWQGAMDSGDVSQLWPLLFFVLGFHLEVAILVDPCVVFTRSLPIEA